MTLEIKNNNNKNNNKTVPSFTTTSAPVVYIYGRARRYKDAFTSIMCRLRPQLVAASAARPR